MAILLTLLIDLLSVVLFVFRITTSNQVMLLISGVIQLMFFIDLLAILLLREKYYPLPAAMEVNMARRRSRRPQKKRPGGLFVGLSCIVSFGVLVFYLFTLAKLFL
ncbi:hypothetical protein JZO70_12180 [Enterococcus sp. 669A]|uniref:DUF3899 domain-containing protein n=1 Tax=Candidatus Enterococcus moelleringii TaxID=2815325 RepID=A0ABS3LBC8_9ENTE|nr:hypothetical protein [Enterococcus sp. 669A]MBO1306926.1 hypothetical protein [Enterococcus sp. 669A]